MNHKIDTITEQNIKYLFDQFYAKIRQYNLLGPIFENAMGSNKSWESHLNHMDDFWSS